jgi:hypothetical protein
LGLQAESFDYLRDTLFRKSYGVRIPQGGFKFIDGLKSGFGAPFAREYSNTPERLWTNGGKCAGD